MPGQRGMLLSLGSERAVTPCTELCFVLQCWRKGLALRGVWFYAGSEGSRRSAGKPKRLRTDHGKITLDDGKKRHLSHSSALSHRSLRITLIQCKLTTQTQTVCLQIHSGGHEEGLGSGICMEQFFVSTNGFL